MHYAGEWERESTPHDLLYIPSLTAGGEVACCSVATPYTGLQDPRTSEGQGSTLVPVNGVHIYTHTFD